jgi:hypothetical protein
MLIAMEPIHFVFFPQTQALLSLLLAVGATILFRKAKGWPALLILIGSAGYFITDGINAFILNAFIGYGIDSPLFRNCINLLDIAGVATVCLPIGLLAFALRATRRT